MFYKIHFVIAFLIAVMACNNSKKDVVFEKFKIQLEQHGLTIDSIDKEGFVYVRTNKESIKISLDNTRLNYHKDSDESHITALVDLVLESAEPVPSWVEAQSNIYKYLYPDSKIDSVFIHQQFNSNLSILYIYHKDSNIIWITKDDLETWGVPKSLIIQTADKNANDLLDQTSIVYETVQNKKMGTIQTKYESLTSAILLASGFESKVKSKIEPHFCAFIPTRGTCYFFSKKDVDFFTKQLKERVDFEYNNAAYPVSKEILMVKAKDH